MKAALEKSGIEYDYIFYPNSSHMLMSDYNRAKEYDNKLYEYLEKYF